MMNFEVNEHEAESRLDRYLRKKLDGVALSRIFGLLRKKKVKVNGKACTGNHRLQQGDQILILEELAAWSKPEKVVTAWSSASVLDIIYEDEHLVIINKPCGMACQGGTGIAEGATLTEALWQRYPESKFGFKAQLAHRIDKETSGIVLACKSGKALRVMNQAFKERELNKQYRTVVKGIPNPRTGDLHIKLERVGDSTRSGKVRGSDAGVEAHTHYRTILKGSGYSLLQVRIFTGRTHQIRVHMAEWGHPLAMDNRYGDFNWNRELKAKGWPSDMFLHSQLLEIPAKVLNKIDSGYPEEGMKFIAPEPSGFLKAFPEIWKLT
jgi:23S rRNA pseudouridine955/2504/2580 synthase